jgi:hypothetical protein
MIFSNDPAVEIDRMFLDPNEPQADDSRPILYLLRCDLQNQYGKETETPALVLSPLLTGLGIMVGIEVLTKLWSGDHNAGTGEIEEFLKSVCSLPGEMATALAQFRHALAHGYRLETIRRKDKQVYIFVVSDVATECECITELGDFKFRISIWRLKDLFLMAITECHRLLHASSEQQSKFMVAKANIGEVEIIR